MQLGRLLLSVPLSGYWPGPPHGLQEALGLIRFGGYLTVTGVAIYFARNLDNVLIGWSCGAEELAYYSRAYFLMLLPSMLATRPDRRDGAFAVGLEGRARTKSGAYRKAVSLTAFFGFPWPQALRSPPRRRCGSSTARMASRHPHPGLAFDRRDLPARLQHGGMALRFRAERARLPALEPRVSRCPLLRILRRRPLGSGGSGIRLRSDDDHGPHRTRAVVAHRAAELHLRTTLAPLAPMLAASLLMGCAVYTIGYLLRTTGASWPMILAGKVITGVLSFTALGCLFIRPIPLSPLERWRWAVLLHIQSLSGRSRPPC